MTVSFFIIQPLYPAYFFLQEFQGFWCSLSLIAYLSVGSAERSIPIAGGIEIRKNIASAYLPAPVPPSYVIKFAPFSIARLSLSTLAPL